MKRSTVYWSMLALAALGIGCGAPQDAAVPAADAASDAAPSASGGSDMLEIAVVPKGVAFQFWLTVKAGAEQAGKDLGVKVIWQGPAKETEVDKQIGIVQDMISRGVDALVLAACDENALVGPVQRAADAGIPVVTIDSGVNSEVPVSFVATDNTMGARRAVETLAGLLDNRGEVGLMPFVPGAATSELREKGFKEGLSAYPDMKLVATLYSMSDVAKGMDATSDMMTSHPNLGGIFGASEPGCIGSAQAIKVAGKTGEVKLVCFDASDEQVQHLREGTIQALIVQNPFKMGYDGVKAAVDAAQGREVPARIDTGVTVVTLENLESPEVKALLGSK